MPTDQEKSRLAYRLRQAKKEGKNMSSNQASQGPRQSRIDIIRAENAALRAEMVDQARAKKSLIAEEKGKLLYTDPITGSVYKVRPRVLTSGNDFTLTANTANAETVIAESNAVPDGLEYMFAPVRRGSDADRTAPYLYGSIHDASSADVSGTLVIKIVSPSGVELDRILTTDSYALSNASVIDWNNRMFFNCEDTKRAKSGSKIQVTLKSASTISTTVTSFTMFINELEKQ